MMKEGSKNWCREQLRKVKALLKTEKDPVRKQALNTAYQKLKRRMVPADLEALLNDSKPQPVELPADKQERLENLKAHIAELEAKPHPICYCGMCRLSVFPKTFGGRYYATSELKEIFKRIPEEDKAMLLEKRRSLSVEDYEQFLIEYLAAHPRPQEDDGQGEALEVQPEALPEVQPVAPEGKTLRVKDPDRLKRIEMGIEEPREDDWE